MDYLGQTPTMTGLPPGWTARTPDDPDVATVVGLMSNRLKPGDKPVDVDSVAANLVGPGSWTRRQVVVFDADQRLVALVGVHDRAAGRTNVEMVASEVVDDAVALVLFRWVDLTASMIAALRGRYRTQLDASAHTTDERLRRWLTDAGYDHVRTWLQMTRPVGRSEAAADGVPVPRPGVEVRRVRKHRNGLPLAEDVQTVHQMLEQSFADHFNSYRESFGEFVQRLREDPWHRWDHWWIATIDLDGRPVPGGALISSVSPPDAGGEFGSYVDYIGVHRRSRGRGVAKALLYTVIADAARRGRHRVGLEVDADSPTGADGLYSALGWNTDYTTQSWHRYVDATTVES